MKPIFSMMLVVLVSFGAAMASASDFNPTPFPLDHKFECGAWVSQHGPYRLLITPVAGNCGEGQARLHVTIFNRRQAIARGLLSFHKNKFCGNLKTVESKNIDLCVWRKGEVLYSNVRKNSPWLPFGAFLQAKEDH